MDNGLSGKYFNLVVGYYGGLVHQPLVIRINNGTAKVVSPPLGFKVEGNLQIVRVIIETEVNGKLVSRHSNVLVIDHLKKKIIRFEPMVNPNDNLINTVVIETLRPSFRGYDYEESPLHPQTESNGHRLCVAFSILFVMDYIHGSHHMELWSRKAQEYADAIKKVFPMPLEIQNQDIEYGGAGVGLGLGLLGGLAIGGLATGALASPRTVVVQQPPYTPYYRY